MKKEELCKKAREIRENSYSPYSGFRVGAALLTKDGNVYGGVNIENASFSPTICAERSAFAAAISAGEQEFEAIAVCGGENAFPPCGVCRQVMSEFCGADFLVFVLSENDCREYTLGELLPEAFGKENMRG
ncbi:MAG: cytidine deaminase [Clostridia bacterium]|nr:cytidine deaminase [Clostridia bacterium]